MSLSEKTIEELEELKTEGYRASKELQKREKEYTFEWCFENLFDSIRAEKINNSIYVIFQDNAEEHRFIIKKDELFKMPF